MGLSPCLSHVVDAGASVVYVWHGAGSPSDSRRYIHACIALDFRRENVYDDTGRTKYKSDCRS